MILVLESQHMADFQKQLRTANQTAPMEDTEIFQAYSTSKDQFPWLCRFCKPRILVLSSPTDKTFAVPWKTCSSAAANPAQIQTFLSFASTNSHSSHSSLSVYQWMSCNGCDISEWIQIYKDISAGAVNF